MATITCLGLGRHCSWFANIACDRRGIHRRLVRIVSRVAPYCSWHENDEHLALPTYRPSFLLDHRNLYATNLWAASEGIWVGCFSFLAVFMITVIGISMLRANQMQEKWKAKLTKAMDDENVQGLGNTSRKYALFILPLVTVLREGVEALVFIGGVTFAEEPRAIPLAVGAGLGLGWFVGFLIYRGGNKMRLHPFFVGSTCLLLMVAAGLVAKGIAAFEAEAWMRATGAQSDDDATYDPRINVWALKCCDPKKPDAGWWGVANALVGWSNVASYISVSGYMLYWGLVSAWLVRLKTKKGKVLAAERRPLLSATPSGQSARTVVAIGATGHSDEITIA